MDIDQRMEDEARRSVVYKLLEERQDKLIARLNVLEARLDFMNVRVVELERQVAALTELLDWDSDSAPDATFRLTAQGEQELANG